MPQGELKITVAQALNTLQGVERVPKLRGKTAYWMGRIAQMVEAVVTAFQKERRRMEIEFSNNKIDADGNPEISADKKLAFERAVQDMLDIEEVLPVNPIKYEDITKEFENDKDEDGKKRPFEIEPRVLRLLGPIVVSNDKDDAAAAAFVPKVGRPAAPEKEEGGEPVLQDEESGD